MCKKVRDIRYRRQVHTFISIALNYEEMVLLIKVLHAATADDDDGDDEDGFHFVFELCR